MKNQNKKRIKRFASMKDIVQEYLPKENARISSIDDDPYSLGCYFATEALKRLSLKSLHVKTKA